MAILRVLLLLLGTIGFGVLAAWIRLLDFKGGRFVLIDSDWHLATLSTGWVLIVLACVGLGAMATLWTLLVDGRLRTGLGWAIGWMKQHPGWSALLTIVFLLGAVDIYSVLSLGPGAGAGAGLPGGHGLSLYLLRDDLRYWLLLGATVQLALAMLTGWPDAQSWRWLAQRWRATLTGPNRTWWLAAVMVPLILAASLSRFALDGIPHFSDALTYLMQGRMLYQGQLSMPAPQHPELWRDSLFFLTEARTIDPVKQIVLAEHGQRFFGKYPIGWPAIVGLFDRVHLLFLANATLAALAALLTGLLAKEIAGRRVAVLAALVMGLSPWLWFSGADFASHVASTCALLAFLWLFLKATRSLDGPSSLLGSLPSCLAFLPFLLSGLALGAAVLIRPGDATNFALPVGLFIAWKMLRQPGTWFSRGLILGLGAVVGAFIYLWCNHQTTGQWLLSPYKLEPRWGSDWVPTWAMPGRFIFQWAQLNSRFPGYGLGSLTLATLSLIVLFHHRHPSASRPAKGLWFLVIGTAIFFVFNTAFGFTTVWWGARWLLPAAPLLAILIAFLIDQLLQSIADTPNTKNSAASGTWAASQFALALLIAATLIGLSASYLGQAYELRIMPPHTVSGAVDRQVRAMGLDHAVVAMPVRGKRAPLDARAGIAFMQVPWDDNPVIYVRAVDGWQAKAVAMYPHHTLYEVLPDARLPEGFILRQVAPEVGSR